MNTPKKQLATIKDVASAAKVSVSTVSAVINETKRVSPELQQRVRTAIDQLDFYPNHSARNLGKGKNRTIAYVVPDIANIGFLDVFRTLNQIARARGYTLVFMTTEGKIEIAQQITRQIIEMRVAGVFLTLSWENVQIDPHLEQLREFGIIVVGLTGPWSIETVNCFLHDEVGAGRQAGAYLRRLGHSRIHCIGPRDSRTAELRWNGITSVFQGAGADFEISFGDCKGYSITDAYNAMSKSVENDFSWTAAVAFNDKIASGMLAALHDHDIQVPDEVSLLSFGSSLADFRRPTITSIRFNTEQMIQKAAQRLFDLLEHVGDLNPEHKYIESEILVRESTRTVTRKRPKDMV